MTDTMTIEAATSEDQLIAIEQLAETIWHQHYTPIIGQQQVLYMLDKFQSLPAMQQQISAQGYEYFSILKNNQLAGYFAIQMNQHQCFLSKLYVDSQYRGQKLGRLGLNFIVDYAQKQQCKTIQLMEKENESTKHQTLSKL